MRELRFVQQAFEGSVLVLEAENGEQFVLPSEQVRDAAAPGQPRERTDPAKPAAWVSAARRTPEPASPATTLGPREIQMRVRAGESAEALAEDSGMALERVLRFALPVLEERARIADEAHRARARRGPGEAATLPFAETVDRRLTAHGIDPTTVTWDAHRREDRQWVVTASWTRGDQRYSAAWTYTRAGRVVAPADDAAGELLSDRPIPLPTAPPRLTLATARPVAPEIVPFPPMPEASTAPLPVLPESPELFDQDSPQAAAELRPDPWQDVESPPLPLSLPAEQQKDEDEPVVRRPKRSRTPRAADAPANVEHPAAGRPGSANPSAHPSGHPSAHPSAHPSTELSRAARGSAARSPVPSWDDILLGVRRERD